MSLWHAVAVRYAACLPVPAHTSRVAGGAAARPTKSTDSSLVASMIAHYTRRCLMPVMNAANDAHFSSDTNVSDHTVSVDFVPAAKQSKWLAVVVTCSEWRLTRRCRLPRCGSTGRRTIINVTQDVIFCLSSSGSNNNNSICCISRRLSILWDLIARTTIVTTTAATSIRRRPRQCVEVLPLPLLMDSMQIVVEWRHLGHHPPRKRVMAVRRPPHQPIGTQSCYKYLLRRRVYKYFTKCHGQNKC